MLTGERQADRLRSQFLAAILRQEVGYFDKGTNTGAVIGHMSGDILTIQEAMGEKVCLPLRPRLSSLAPLLHSCAHLSCRGAFLILSLLQPLPWACVALLSLALRGLLAARDRK